MTHISAQTRLKTFDIPHKGFRNLLAQLTQLTATTDYSDSDQLNVLEKTGSDLFRLLTEHAIDEDELVLAPLEQRCPGATLQNSAEHEQIEQEQTRLETQFWNLINSARRGIAVHELAEQFYFDINRFHSAYLLHMLEEEEETQRLLWKHFTDDELLNIRKQIIGRMPVESQMLWYRYAIPAMSHLGRLQWLSAVKQAAPAAFFGQVMEVVETVLPAPEFLRLSADLSSLGH